MTSSRVYARFASLATSLGILVVGSHPKLFLRFGLDLKFLWPSQSIEQQASSLFLEYYQNGIFCCCCLGLFFRHWRQCHRFCQVTQFSACPAIVAYVTRGVCVMTALFFCCLVAELLLLFVSAMLTVTIVAIVALSVWPLSPALVGKTLQFAFVVHALLRLMPLRQYLSSRYEYHCDTHNAFTMPLLCLLTRPPCGFKADCHGLPHCIWGAPLVSALASHNDCIDHIHHNRRWH
jgi:hypothetical protein